MSNHWKTDKPTTDEQVLELLRFGIVYNPVTAEYPVNTARTEARMQNCAEYLRKRLEALAEREPVGLFWFTADGNRHFVDKCFVRGDIHDNGRPIHVAYQGEPAK